MIEIVQDRAQSQEDSRGIAVTLQGCLVRAGRGKLSKHNKAQVSAIKRKLERGFYLAW